MNKVKAHSLIEVLIALVIISILTITIFPAIRAQIRNARGQRILEELKVIAKAGADYYKSTETVPDSVNALVDNGYMENVSLNAYGHGYSFNIATADKITVRTTVPAGLLAERMDSRLTVMGGEISDTVDFSQPVEYVLPEEQFEKQYLYEPGE